MDTISSRARWNEAAIAGLVLGAATILMQLLSVPVSKISGGVGLAMLASVLGFVVWAAKFCLCIWLMMFFMKRLVNRYQGVTNEDTRKFGISVALLSALIVSAYVFAMLYFSGPEELESAMQTALAQSPVSIDSNMQATLDRMMDKLPVIYFFVNLLYCWLFGTVVSLILSRNIPSRNPFEQNFPDEQ